MCTKGVVIAVFVCLIQCTVAYPLNVTRFDGTNRTIDAIPSQYNVTLSDGSEITITMIPPKHIHIRGEMWNCPIFVYGEDNGYYSRRRLAHRCIHARYGEDVAKWVLTETEGWVYVPGWVWEHTNGWVYL